MARRAFKIGATSLGDVRYQLPGGAANRLVSVRD
jgi:hypothetical protein